MTDINATGATNANHAANNTQPRFHQAMEKAKSAGTTAGKATADVGKVVLDRLTHPDAGVVAVAFNIRGSKVLAAALPSVKALKSGNLENILQHSTYFLSIVDIGGKAHIFTGNPSSGIVEVGKPNFASKPFNAAGMSGVAFSNSRTGGDANKGVEITASVNSGVLISNMAPKLRAKVQKGMSKAVGKMFEKFAKKMLNSVRNDKFELQKAKKLKGFVIKNTLELVGKKPANDGLIYLGAKAAGSAAAKAVNNSGNFMVGAAWRDDVRINENHTVSLHGATNATVDFKTLKKAMDDVLK